VPKRAVISILALFALVSTTPTVSATFGRTTATNTALGGDTVAPATNFSATTRCSLAITKPVADLSWTATTSGWADGYQIERWKGAILETTVTINNPATTTYTDAVTGGLLTGTTYTWRITAKRASWKSTTAAATATTPPICL
jgi:hypothetical protein